MERERRSSSLKSGVDLRVLTKICMMIDVSGNVLDCDDLIDGVFEVTVGGVWI